MNFEELAWKRIKQNNNFKDTDRDGVINILDCRPHNKHKQGTIHKLGNWVQGKGYQDDFYRKMKGVRQKAKEKYTQQAIKEYEKKKVQFIQREELAKARHKAKPLSVRTLKNVEGFIGGMGKIAKHTKTPSELINNKKMKKFF